MKIFLILLQLAASGSDAYFTNRGELRGNFHERNPIARPFVGSTASRVAYFSFGAGVKIGVPLVIGKKHPKLAKTLAISGIADNSVAAIYTATH